MDRTTLVTMTAEIVASHASMNEMDLDALVDEIQNVYAKLAGLAGVVGGAHVSGGPGGGGPAPPGPGRAR